MSIGPPRQVKLIFYSTPTAYKLTVSRVCLYHRHYQFQNICLEIQKLLMMKTALFSNSFNFTFWQRTIRGRCHHLIFISNVLLYTTKYIARGCEQTEGQSTSNIYICIYIVFIIFVVVVFFCLLHILFKLKVAHIYQILNATLFIYT